MLAGLLINVCHSLFSITLFLSTSLLSVFHPHALFSYTNSLVCLQFCLFLALNLTVSPHIHPSLSVSLFLVITVCLCDCLSVHSSLCVFETHPSCNHILSLRFSLSLRGYIISCESEHYACETAVVTHYTLWLTPRPISVSIGLCVFSISIFGDIELSKTLLYNNRVG